MIDWGRPRMNASSRAASLKLVLSANILNLAVYSSAIMPVVIFRACSWAQAILSRSGSPKVLSMLDSNLARVANVEVYDKITLVSFSAQTCAIPLCIKEREYRIFILSSANMSSCMVMAMWIDQTNCSALSLLPSKYSGSATLMPLGEWLPVGILVRMACATADVALAAASVMSLWASRVQSWRALLVVWSWASCWDWLWKSSCRKGPLGPSDSQYLSVSWCDIVMKC